MENSLKASREKLRFEVDFRNERSVRSNYSGLASMEDLWDFSIEGLEIIGRKLETDIAEAKAAVEGSKFGEKAKQDPSLEQNKLRLAIVSAIYDVKVQERDARATAAEKRAMKERLLELKAKKKEAAYENMTEEELDKLLSELGD